MATKGPHMAVISPIFPEEGVVWEAPAKINLDLRVGPPADDGFHPVRSHVQTVEYCDILRFVPAEEDHIDVTGADLGETDENLVVAALDALRRLTSVPPLAVELEKRIPHRAGLGGGSSDAAAVIKAVPGANLDAHSVAATLGSDVPFFLYGGFALTEGRGEMITPVAPVADYAVAVMLPGFGLSTPDVYAAWDRLDGPEGPGVGGTAIPPGLRDRAPLVNDLVPAALSLHPELADWMTDLSSLWGRPVLMSGSGSACFGFFMDHDEAEGALVGAVADSMTGFAATTRPIGVASCGSGAGSR